MHTYKHMVHSGTMYVVYRNPQGTLNLLLVNGYFCGNCCQNINSKVQAHRQGSQKGGYIEGYIVDILYSFKLFSMMQSLHPVASLAYASKNLSITVEF